MFSLVMGLVLILGGLLGFFVLLGQKATLTFIGCLFIIFPFMYFSSFQERRSKKTIRSSRSFFPDDLADTSLNIALNYDSYIAEKEAEEIALLEKIYKLPSPRE